MVKPMTAPRTAAGRALLKEWEWEGTEESAAVILAIEAEAAAETLALLRAQPYTGYYQSAPHDRHICATCGKEYATPANAKRHVNKKHRPTALLLDNDEAVGVLARAMHNIHNTDHEMGFPGCADEGDPEWWLSGARRLIAALREQK